MVYSYAKRLLFEYIRCLPNNSDDVIHVETDSIYFAKKHTPQFLDMLNIVKQISDYPIAIGNELGNVKVEKDTTEDSYFLGKKFYYIAGPDPSSGKYKQSLIIKGSPKSTTDENGSKINLVDKDLYKETFNWRPGDPPIRKTFSTMKKVLYGNQTEISMVQMTRTIKSDYNEYQTYYE